VVHLLFRTNVVHHALLPTMTVQWNECNVTKGNWAVQIDQIGQQLQKRDENMISVMEQSTRTAWHTPDDLNSLSPMVLSGDGYVIQAQNVGWVSVTSGSLRLPKWVGSSTIDTIRIVGESIRLLYDEVLCGFTTREDIAVERKVGIKEWTNHLRKDYYIQAVTIIP